jgi:hypothetical protein
MSYEVEFMVLAVGLYVYDSVVLLYTDEGILTADRNGRWRAILGSDDFMFWGRSIYVVNLLTPHAPTFRLGWKFDRAAVEGSTAWTGLVHELHSVAPFTIMAGVALYLLVPIGLFTRMGPPCLLLAVVLLYASIAAALIQLYRKRAATHVTGRQFAVLALECMACPPFGVNLVRRVALAQVVSEQFTDAAQRLLGIDEWSELGSRCAERVGNELELVVDSPVRAAAMESQRRRLCSSGNDHGR